MLQCTPSEPYSIRIVKTHVHCVLVILRYTQVSPRDGKRAVAVDFHDNRRRHAAIPGVVAKRFSQRVAGHADLEG